MRQANNNLCEAVEDELDLDELYRFMMAGGNIDCGPDTQMRNYALDLCEAAGLTIGFTREHYPGLYRFARISGEHVHMGDSHPDDVEIVSIYDFPEKFGSDLRKWDEEMPSLDELWN